MSFIMNILVALAALVGAHVLLYHTIVRFVGVEGTGARIALLVTILALSVSFIVSAIVLRLHSGPVTRGFALLGFFWLGLVIYLIMAMALVWLVHGVSSISGLAPNMRIVTLSSFALALAVSLYGVWNAHHPRVTKVTVEIRDLPDRWKDGTIVHLSDAHLGTSLGTGFLERVVRETNALEPDLVLITGDLFDGMSGGLPDYVEPLSSFEASRGVFFVTGNHESYQGLERCLSVLERTTIRVLDDEVVDVDGLQIVGLSYPVFDGKQVNGLDLARDIDPGKPSILMYHTPSNVVEPAGDLSSQQSMAYLSPDASFSFQRAHGIDLQLSGHSHQGQFFPFTLLTRWIYGGYDHGLHEIDGFTLYTTSGVGFWGPPLRVGSFSEIVAIRLTTPER